MYAHLQAVYQQRSVAAGPVEYLDREPINSFVEIHSLVPFEHHFSSTDQIQEEIEPKKDQISNR